MSFPFLVSVAFLRVPSSLLPGSYFPPGKKTNETTAEER